MQKKSNVPFQLILIENEIKKHLTEIPISKRECPDCSRCFSRAEHLRSHRNRCRSEVENAELLVVEVENKHQLNDELWRIEFEK